jgi:hypothetical protein
MPNINGFRQPTQAYSGPHPILRRAVPAGAPPPPYASVDNIYQVYPQPTGAFAPPAAYPAPASPLYSTGIAVAQTAHARTSGAPTASEVSRLAASVRNDINKSMTPMQKHAAQFLHGVGLATSVLAGGAAVALGLTALVGVASQVGVPVGAAAAVAGVATLLAGAAMTMLVTAGLRQILRRSLKKQGNSALAGDIAQLKDMRRQLRNQPGQLTAADKSAIKEADRALRKVGSFGSHLNGQFRYTGRAAVGVAKGTVYGVLQGLRGVGWVGLALA